MTIKRAKKSNVDTRQETGTGNVEKRSHKNGMDEGQFDQKKIAKCL